LASSRRVNGFGHFAAGYLPRELNVPDVRVERGHERRERDTKQAESTRRGRKNDRLSQRRELLYIPRRNARDDKPLDQIEKISNSLIARLINDTSGASFGINVEHLNLANRPHTRGVWQACLDFLSAIKNRT
jgi:hypothetical protein